MTGLEFADNLVQITVPRALVNVRLAELLASHLQELQLMTLWDVVAALQLVECFEVSVGLRGKCASPILRTTHVSVLPGFEGVPADRPCTSR